MTSQSQRSEINVVAPALMLQLLSGQRIVEKKTSFDEASATIGTETVVIDFQNLKGKFATSRRVTAATWLKETGS